MLDTLPKPILDNILEMTNLQDLPTVNRISKALNSHISPTIQELKQLYFTLADKKPDELVEACLHSLKMTQALMMSNYLYQLDFKHIIALAHTSYDHAKIVLKSNFIQKGIKKTTAVPITVPERPPKNRWEAQARAMQDIQKMTYEDLIMDLEAVTVKLNEDDLNRYEFYKKCKPHDILDEIAKKDQRYANLVLIYAGEMLSGYKLMEMAKLHMGTAKMILNAPTLRKRLKPGHVIGIAKSSADHAKYILLNHLKLVDAEGVKQIADLNQDYAALTSNAFITILSMLPIMVVTNKPELSKPVVLALLKDHFYSSSNKAWLAFKAKKPTEAELIFEALKIGTSLYVNTALIDHIIVRLMRISTHHAKEIFSLSNMDKRLDQAKLEKLAAINEEYATLMRHYLKQVTHAEPKKVFR